MLQDTAPRLGLGIYVTQLNGLSSLTPHRDLNVTHRHVKHLLLSFAYADVQNEQRSGFAYCRGEIWQVSMLLVMKSIFSILPISLTKNGPLL